MTRKVPIALMCLGTLLCSHSSTMQAARRLHALPTIPEETPEELAAFQQGTVAPSMTPLKSPYILMNVTNMLPRRHLIIRSMYLSVNGKSLPPLSITVDRPSGIGQQFVKIDRFISRGRGKFKRKLEVKHIEFIDPQDGTVLRTLDAATLANKDSFKNIRIERGQKPPRSPHPSTSAGRHAPKATTTSTSALPMTTESAPDLTRLPTPPPDL